MCESWLLLLLLLFVVLFVASVFLFVCFVLFFVCLLFKRARENAVLVG